MSRRSFTNFNEHDETELRINRLYHNVAPRREASAGIPVRSVNHDIQNVLADCCCVTLFGAKSDTLSMTKSSDKIGSDSNFGREAVCVCSCSVSAVENA